MAVESECSHRLPDSHYRWPGQTRPWPTGCGRFTAAGHGDTLETLLEVLEQEAGTGGSAASAGCARRPGCPLGDLRACVPLALRQQLGELSDGSFVDRGVNVLAVLRGPTGRSVLYGWCSVPPSATWRYRPAYDFLLPTCPKGPRSPLFTLIAERYERRSLGITSNLVFSQWEHIFANPMATAAAIDTTRSSWNSTSPTAPEWPSSVVGNRG